MLLRLSMFKQVTVSFEIILSTWKSFENNRTTILHFWVQFKSQIPFKENFSWNLIEAILLVEIGVTFKVYFQDYY